MINRKYEHSVHVLHIKSLTSLAESIIVESWRYIDCHFFQMNTIFFLNVTVLSKYSIYVSVSGLLNLIISDTHKFEFCRIWIRCHNNITNGVDGIVKREVYPHYVLKIFMVDLYIIF